MELDATHFPFASSIRTGGLLTIEVANITGPPGCNNNHVAIRVLGENEWDFSGLSSFVEKIAKENPGCNIYMMGFREYEEWTLEYNVIHYGNEALKPILSNFSKEEFFQYGEDFGAPVKDCGGKNLIPFLHIIAVPRGVPHPNMIVREDGSRVSMQELKNKYPDLTLEWESVTMAPDVGSEVHILRTNFGDDGVMASISKPELVLGHLFVPTTGETASIEEDLENFAGTFIDETETVQIDLDGIVKGNIWKETVKRVAKANDLGDDEEGYAGFYDFASKEPPEELADLVVPTLTKKLLQGYAVGFRGSKPQPEDLIPDTNKIVVDTIVQHLISFPFHKKADRLKVREAIKTEVALAYQNFAKSLGVPFKSSSSGIVEEDLEVSSAEYDIYEIRKDFAAKLLTAVFLKVKNETQAPILGQLPNDSCSSELDGLKSIFEIDCLIACSILTHSKSKTKFQDECKKSLLEKVGDWQMDRKAAVDFGCEASDVKHHKCYATNNARLRDVYLTGKEKQMMSLRKLPGSAFAELANIFPAPRIIGSGDRDHSLYTKSVLKRGADTNFSITVKGRNGASPFISLVGQEAKTYGQSGFVTACAAALKLRECQEVLGKLVGFPDMIQEHISKGGFRDGISTLVDKHANFIRELRPLLEWRKEAEIVECLDAIQAVFDEIVSQFLGPFTRMMEDEKELDTVEDLRHYIVTQIKGTEEEIEKRLKEKDLFLQELGKECLLKKVGGRNGLPASNDKPECDPKLHELLCDVSKLGQQALTIIGEATLFDTTEIKQLLFDVEGTQHQNMSLSEFSNLCINDLLVPGSGQVTITWGYGGDLVENPLDEEVAWKKFMEEHSREYDKNQLWKCPELSDDDDGVNYEKGKVELAKRFHYKKGKALLKALKTVRQDYAAAISPLEVNHMRKFLTKPSLRMAVIPGGAARIQPVYKKDSQGKDHLVEWIIFFYDNIQLNDSNKTATCTIKSEEATDHQLKLMLRPRIYEMLHENLEEYKKGRKENFTGVLNIGDPGYFRAFVANKEIQAIRLRGDNHGGLELLLKGNYRISYDDCYEVMATFATADQPFVQAYRVELNRKARNRDFKWLVLPAGASRGNKGYVEATDDDSRLSAVTHKASVYKLDCAKQAALESMSRVPFFLDAVDAVQEKIDPLNPFHPSYENDLKLAITGACMKKGLSISIKTVKPRGHEEFVPFDPGEFRNRDIIFAYAVRRNHTVGLLGNMLLDPSEKNALSLCKANLDLLAGGEFEGFDRIYEVSEIEPRPKKLNKKARGRLQLQRLEKQQQRRRQHLG